ncbi:MAG: hypothetical protein HFJ55_00280 [Clostridia bacterium]|jgi:hypothetical protein|nr:hypothetical protein [Clostridia bacterium]
MTKAVIREIIISLLVCLAVLLILSVLLYNYIPSNKVVPEVVKYTPSKEIETQLNATVEDNSEEILMTYEITAQDLDNYERTKEYNPGKANPFATISNDNTGNDNNGNEPSTGENETNNNNSNNNNNEKPNNSGSLFENNNSK